MVKKIKGEFTKKELYQMRAGMIRMADSDISRREREWFSKLAHKLHELEKKL